MSPVVPRGARDGTLTPVIPPPVQACGCSTRQSPPPPRRRGCRWSSSSAAWCMCEGDLAGSTISACQHPPVTAPVSRNVAACGSMWQRVTACGSMWQHVAACVSLLRCGAWGALMLPYRHRGPARRAHGGRGSRRRGRRRRQQMHRQPRLPRPGVACGCSRPWSGFPWVHHPGHQRQRGKRQCGSCSRVVVAPGCARSWAVGRRLRFTQRRRPRRADRGRRDAHRRHGSRRRASGRARRTYRRRGHRGGSRRSDRPRH